MVSEFAIKIRIDHPHGTAVVNPLAFFLSILAISPTYGTTSSSKRLFNPYGSTWDHGTGFSPTSCSNLRPLIICKYLFAACRWPRANPKKTCAGPLPTLHRLVTNIDRGSSLLNICFAIPARQASGAARSSLCVGCLQNEVLPRTDGKIRLLDVPR